MKKPKVKNNHPEIDVLIDRLLTQRNRIDIVLELIEAGKFNLLATPLEDNHYTSQLIINDFCIKVKDGTDN